MMELHLPRDACGTACFVTPEHGRSASIPLPLGAVVIPACSMERKDQSVYITNVTGVRTLAWEEWEGFRP